jgi:outer membrane receptor for ferrienterochelin and colicins
MSQRILLILLVLSLTFRAQGQNTLEAVITDSLSGEALIGATAVLEGTTLGGAADVNGTVTLAGIPDGEHTLVFSFLGHATRKIRLSFPPSRRIHVKLLREAGELDEVIIEGTRSNRSIADIPTRVEVLTEEIDEASTMDPSKISHLLTHSTGIQVQYTSATSNTANVRIQGLDGRYTQILKDGFPLYGGFSGSLSIMQIPPLDLRQVEYIKGGASTLFGGGAISGLINLLSKNPEPEETLLHLNASSLGALDVNTYMSRRVGNIGFTLLAQRNTHAWFDADADGFTDLPELTKYNLNPRIFFHLGERTNLVVGATLTQEERQGGDVTLFGRAAPDSTHFYLERNEVSRSTTQMKFEHGLGPNSTLTLRNSFNFFDRLLAIIPGPELEENAFSGRQVSSFSELSWTQRGGKNVLVAGLNYYSDEFNETDADPFLVRTEVYHTLGGFANYTFDVGRLLSFEAGLRGDQVMDGEFFALPRLYTLFKWSPKWTTRIGGGFGYRNASIFVQEAELLGYRNVRSIDRATTEAERSRGMNADIGFRSTLGEDMFITVNQLFFMNQVLRPLYLGYDANADLYSFYNAAGSIRTMGGETFFKLGYKDVVLFVGYTYTEAVQDTASGSSVLPLTPMHSLKGDLLYALPGKWRIGLDYEFKSQQVLNNGRTAPSFWTFGALVEHTWRTFTFFGNVENYTDVRQTRFESLLSEPHGTPQFTDVWAPLDGIVLNAGVKVRL